MNTNITITGQIMAILSKEYEGQKTTYIQFLMDTEKKGMEILKVKITKDEDILKLQKGSIISVAVSITAVNGNIYYSQLEAIKILRETKQ
jgi:hypothetical protein